MSVLRNVSWTDIKRISYSYVGLVSVGDEVPEYLRELKSGSLIFLEVKANDLQSIVSFNDIFDKCVGLKDVVFKSKAHFFSRLTLTMTDKLAPTHFQGKVSLALKTYDILCVRPVSEKQLKVACTELDVDMILVDPEPFCNGRLYINDVLSAACLARGITIELRLDFQSKGLDFQSKNELLNQVKAAKIFLQAMKAMRKRNAVVQVESTELLDAINFGAVFLCCTDLSLNLLQIKQTLARNSAQIVTNAFCRKNVYMGAGFIP